MRWRNVQRPVQLLRQPRAQHDLAHEQEQRDRDQQEVRARVPQHLADEEPERPVGESEPENQREHAEHRGDVDPRAEEEQEERDQHQELRDRQRPGVAAERRDDEHHPDEQDEEDDRNHALRSSVPSASSTSRASSS
jgi:hypothetical protein